MLRRIKTKLRGGPSVRVAPTEDLDATCRQDAQVNIGQRVPRTFGPVLRSEVGKAGGRVSGPCCGAIRKRLERILPVNRNTRALVSDYVSSVIINAVRATTARTDLTRPALDRLPATAAEPSDQDLYSADPVSDNLSHMSLNHIVQTLNQMYVRDGAFSIEAFEARQKEMRKAFRFREKLKSIDALPKHQNLSFAMERWLLDPTEYTFPPEGDPTVELERDTPDAPFIRTSEPLSWAEEDDGIPAPITPHPEEVEVAHCSGCCWPLYTHYHSTV